MRGIGRLISIALKRGSYIEISSIKWENDFTTN